MKLTLKRKGGFLLSFFVFLNLLSFSQNLVPNWDFEEYFTCPTGPDQFDGYIKDWYNPSNDYPSYCNSCSLSPYSSVPMNRTGYNFARSGNGYAWVFLYSYVAPERAYISVKLNEQLQSGNIYCIGFYLNLPNSIDSVNSGIRFAANKIGILFTDSEYHYSTDYVIPAIPQIVFSNPDFYTDTLNWMLCYTQYTAVGGEQYMTIGNFDLDANTNLIQVSNSNNWGAAYYIDDAFVYKCSDVATAEAGEDVHVCKGDSVQIGMQTLSGYKYQWLPSIGLSNDTIGNPYAHPPQTTKYYLHLNKYMETIDSVTVYVDNCSGSFSVPNAFTPDGNGKNDIFKITGKNIQSVHGIIFNRWGMKLFEWNEMNSGWDGKYNGSYVSSGVYFYIINVTYDDGSVEEKKGTVEVIR